MSGDGLRSFVPGHELSTVHGVWSARVVEPVAQGYLELVLTDDSLSHLHQRRWGPQLAAWAKAEARRDLFERFVESMPIERAATAPAGRIPPLEMLRKLDAAALTHRDRLGLTPMSAARLGRDVAQARAADIASIMAELHRQEQAERAAGGSS